MSGPKCGSVSVNNELFEETRRQFEKNEREELRRLEKKERLEEKERRRLEDLRRREQARQERESERLRREQERAEQNRKREMQNLDHVRSELNSLVAARGELERRFPGIKLPPIPSCPDPDLGSVDSIRGSAAEIVRLARQYKRDVERALMCHHQAVAAERGTTETKAWAAQFRMRAIRTAQDVVSALEPDALFVADNRQRAQLEAMARRAHEMVTRLLGASPGDLSDETLSSLEAVLSCDDAESAHAALDRLEELLRAEAARREAEKRREHEREEALRMERQRERVRDVAEAIGDVLEDMGYRVSGLDETAFVRNGHLYVIHRDWPDHAVRLEFDPTSDRIRSVPLRVMGGDASPDASAGVEGGGTGDKNFDTHWCEGTNGILGLKQLAARRGVALSFSREHRPGEKPLDMVPDRQLGERICLTRQEEIEFARQKVRARQ